LTERMETGPLKRSDITIAKSDSQRGPARTRQLGMQRRAFKSDIARENDLFAIAGFDRQPRCRSQLRSRGYSLTSARSTTTSSPSWAVMWVSIRQTSRSARTVAFTESRACQSPRP
jgi:hypothetical protein